VLTDDTTPRSNLSRWCRESSGIPVNADNIIVTAREDVALLIEITAGCGTASPTT
jgi:hypothetical protein